jgi:hypothetical protein
MTAKELRAETAVEFDALQQDVAGRHPTVREKTAAAAFLAQFYSGIENVLKRLSRFHGVDLPVGENWHLELFHRFCAPAQAPLPELMDPALARQLGPFRRFRHVVHHGYGFQIEWDRMREGLDQVEQVLTAFRDRVEAHLEVL